MTSLLRFRAILTDMGNSMYVIVNKLGERMYQYEPFECYDIALKCLKNAQTVYPNAGFRICEL